MSAPDVNRLAELIAVKEAQAEQLLAAWRRCRREVGALRRKLNAARRAGVDRG